MKRKSDPKLKHSIRFCYGVSDYAYCLHFYDNDIYECRLEESQLKKAMPDIIDAQKKLIEHAEKVILARHEELDLIIKLQSALAEENKD